MACCRSARDAHAPPHVVRATVAAALLLAAGAVRAQGAPAPERAFSLVPTASIGLTASDNADLLADKQSDLITRASAGVNVRMNGARVKGFVDYSLTGVLRAKESSRNELQNALKSALTAELLEKRFFVDVLGSVSQQLLSPFGARSVDPTLGEGNRAEVASLSIVPSVRGTLAGWAAYQGRVGTTITRSGDFAATNADSRFASVSLSRTAPAGSMGGSVSLGRQNTDYQAGRRTESDNLDLELSYAPNSQLLMTALAGRERNDFSSAQKESHGSSGLRVQWQPSVRTKLSVERRNRYFGSSHDIAFAHRSRRTAWTFTDSRDVVGNENNSSIAIGNAYDLLFDLYKNIEADSIRRDQLVRDLLVQRGLDPTQPIFRDFLFSALTVQRRESLSLSIIGLRNTLTVTQTLSDGRRLDTISGVNDPFALDGRIRTFGLAATLSHQVTPLSVLSASWARSNAKGDVTQSSTLDTLSLGWTTRLSPRANATLGTRYARADGSTSPYTERAVSGSLSMQF